MTQNINIRFLGTANMGAVHKELAGIETRFKALNAAMMTAAQVAPGSKGAVDVKFLDQLNKKVGQARHQLQTAISAYGDFGIQSAIVADHTDVLTDRIRKQKFGLTDLVREHKNLRDVYRQQMNLRNATVLEWGRNPEGTTNADVITRNRNVLDSTAKGWRRLSTEMGFYNTVLRSVSDQTVKWGKNTQWAGRQLMVGITMPVAMAGAAAGAMAYQVDKGLTQVVKVYGDAATALTTSDEMIKRQTMETARYMSQSIGQSVGDTLEITQQLAATGETGMELQQRVAEVSRARLLGELDLQEAMNATVTLQSVYGYSSRELGDAFNYMNSMENQTVLTMQDFVIGIPKVSGVIKELGGDITEVGTLLAAMKIAGIDAAEGANAIKSIAFKVMAPTPQARDLFEAATGKTYEETVEGTDDVIERLMLIGEAMKTIESRPEKVDVIAKMFGLYQGSKALSIIGQLTDGSEQMTRALEVATAGTAEWADTANREVEKLTGSNWNKLQQQWQTLKIDLAEMGNAFLVMAIPILEVVNKMVNWFNNLDESTKNWIIRLTAIAAAIGPLIMLAGLMGNLIGNVGKFTTFITSLGLKFKILNTDELAQLRISKMLRSGVSEEANAYGVLAFQIDKATAAIRQHTIAQLQKNGATPLSAALQSGKAKVISPMFGPGGNFVPQVHSAKKLQDASAMIAQHSAETDKWWKRINGRTAAWAAVGTAGMATMVAGSEGLAGNISQALFTASMALPIIAEIGGTDKAKKGLGVMVTKAKDLGAVVKSSVGPAFKTVLNFLKPIGAVIAGMAGPILAIGGAIAGIGWLLNRDVENAKKKMENFTKSAETYAEVIGFTYREAGQIITETGEVIDTIDTKVEKFIEKNRDAADILQRLTRGTDQQKAEAAVAEGLKARLGGATAEQAEEAAVIAWRVIDKTLSEEEMLVRIRAMIDFGDTQQVLNQQVEEMAKDFNKAITNGFEVGTGEGILRMLGRDSTITAEGKVAAEAAATAIVDKYITATEEEKPRIMEALASTFETSDSALFQRLMANNADDFHHLGIKTLQDVRDQLNAQLTELDPGSVPGNQNLGDFGKMFGDPRTLKLTADEIGQLARAAEAEQMVLKQLLDTNMQLTDEQKRGIKTVEQYKDAMRELNTTMTVDEARDEWDEWLKRSMSDGKKWTDAERLRRLNIYRTAAGLEEATHWTQQFNNAMGQTAMVDPWSTTATKMSDLVSQLPDADMLSGEASNFFDAYKDTYTTAASNIVNEAAAIANNQWDDMADKISAKQKAQREALDAEHEAAQDAFDKRVKAFDSRWENRMDAFAKKWDKRRENTEKAYDARIQKIQDTIDAEEKAEEVRQRIFEAEKTRMARLAELANRNIDFNAAMNTGNLDEAAKIANDVAAAQSSWMLEDTEAAGGDASQKRVDRLNSRIDKLEEEKDARLKLMEDIEEREKKQLEARKERERELLDAQKEALDDAFEARKDSMDESFAYENKMRERRRAAEQRLFDQQLAALMAAQPKTKKEMNKFVRDLQALYDDFGVDLTADTKAWAGIVGRQLGTASSIATKKMANDTNWNELGRLVAENMAEGAFNMSLTEFIKWAAGGELPSSAKVGASTKSIRPIKTADGTKWVLNGSGVPKHEGGMIGKPGKRTGKSGSLSSDEVPINALVGEAVLNRRASRNLGEDVINHVNRTGELPVGLGYGGPEVDTNAAFGIATVIQGFRRMMLEGALNMLNTGLNVSPVVGDDGPSMMYPGGWRMPAKGPVTSRFGYRFHPILRQWLGHTGTDIGAPMGAPIYAAKGGRVLFTGPNGGYGNWTEIGHGAGVSTGYAHQSYIKVRPGDAVKTGQVIGAVGSTGRSTGPHLHFEYMQNGRKLNPNKIIPGLEDGGFVVKPGLAELHEKETVVTRPLTEKLETGIESMGQARPIEINFNGPINGIDDLERAMIDVMDKIDNRVGKSRRVGVRK